jgi:4-hydroxy-tetrahydrodipicolinate reductase
VKPAVAAVDQGRHGSTHVDVLHFGLGPIGLASAKLVEQRQSLRSVAAVDVNPDLLDRDLGELSGAQSNGVAVSNQLTPAAGRAVAIHCTGSALPAVAAQLLQLVRAGYHVVSTCEQLSYPWDEAPDIARELDAAARSAGVAVVGTGVNPGFAMDYLPLVLTAATSRVDKVTVHRVQNASLRRVPLQQKVGAGLTVDEFAERRARGGFGHAGFRQSVQAIAAGLGWELDDVVESLEPAIATERIEVAIGVVEPGQVTGINQRAVGMRDGRELIHLHLEMQVGRDDARDHITIDGAEPIEMVIPGGLHGDTATAAIVVNTVARIVEAPAGLRTMVDLPPPCAAE